MAMNRKIDFIGIFRSFYQVFNKRLHFCGGGVANSIGNVNRCSAAFNCGIYNLRKKIPIASCCVLCRKFDIAAIFCRVFYHLFGFPKHLFGCHFEFILHMKRTCCNKEVYARVGGNLYCLPRGIYIL